MYGPQLKTCSFSVCEPMFAFTSSFHKLIIGPSTSSQLSSVLNVQKQQQHRSFSHYSQSCAAKFAVLSFNNFASIKS